MAIAAPILLHEADVALYAADSAGQPLVARPVWCGAGAETVRLTEERDLARWWPLGASAPVRREILARYSLEIDRLWAVSLWDASAFSPAVNQRFGLVLTWRDPDSQLTYTRTYGDVSAIGLNQASQGVAQFVETQRFEAATCVVSVTPPGTALLPTGRFATSIGDWQSTSTGTTDGGSWVADGYAAFGFSAPGTARIAPDRYGGGTFSLTAGRSYWLRWRSRSVGAGLSLTPTIRDAGTSALLWTGGPCPQRPGTWQRYGMRLTAASSVTAKFALEPGVTETGTVHLDDVDLRAE